MDKCHVLLAGRIPLSWHPLLAEFIRGQQLQLDYYSWAMVALNKMSVMSMNFSFKLKLIVLINKKNAVKKVSVLRSCLILCDTALNNVLYHVWWGKGVLDSHRDGLGLGDITDGSWYDSRSKVTWDYPRKNNGYPLYLCKNWT